MSHFCNSNYNGSEMKLHAELTKLLKGDSMGLDTIKVYQLYHVDIYKSGNASRATALPFSSMFNMQTHTVSMILNNQHLDSRFKAAIELLRAKDLSGNWEKILETFRTAQLENSKPLGFDIYFDDEPQVML